MRQGAGRIHHVYVYDKTYMALRVNEVPLGLSLLDSLYSSILADLFTCGEPAGTAVITGVACPSAAPAYNARLEAGGPTDVSLVKTAFAGDAITPPGLPSVYTRWRRPRPERCDLLRQRPPSRLPGLPCGGT
jgi:hypothetical protein